MKSVTGSWLKNKNVLSKRLESDLLAYLPTEKPTSGISENLPECGKSLDNVRLNPEVGISVKYQALT